MTSTSITIGGRKLHVLVNENQVELLWIFNYKDIVIGKAKDILLFLF